MGGFIRCDGMKGRKPKGTHVRFLFFIFFLFAYADVPAQTQLILLKRETVIARWEEGDLLQYKLKSGEKGLGRIRQLHEFFLVTASLDTIYYHRIAKFRVHQRIDVTRGLGGALFMGGILYFLIDQFNTSFIVFGGGQFSRRVITSSLSMVALGTSMVFLKPRYQKTRGRSMRVIDSSSLFYRPKPR